MPLFRFHAGSLEESLKTTIIVKCIDDLCKYIKTKYTVDMGKCCIKKLGLSINPYPDKLNNFDARIGWYTHVVIIKMYKECEMFPIGFLSEDLYYEPNNPNDKYCDYHI